MKLASVLLAIGCLLSSVNAQWIETNIYLPDSFGGLTYPQCVVYNTTNNAVYVGGRTGSCVLAVDGATNQKIARIPTGSNVTALCYNPTNNKVYSVSHDGAP